MQIIFEKIGFKYRKLIKKIYQKAVELTNNSLDNLSVSLSFVDEKEIQKLNKQFREVDKATDVLSFPLLDIKYPQKISDFEEDVSPDGILYLGDVVICPSVAKRQAKYYNHSKKREISFLALHGLLHVLGYDHIEKEDEEIMMAESEKILQSLNIKRKN